MPDCDYTGEPPRRHHYTDEELAHRPCVTSPEWYKHECCVRIKTLESQRKALAEEAKRLMEWEKFDGEWQVNVADFLRRVQEAVE